MFTKVPARDERFAWEFPGRPRLGFGCLSWATGLKWVFQQSALTELNKKLAR
jgi:hypothetical protein